MLRRKEVSTPFSFSQRVVARRCRGMSFFFYFTPRSDCGVGWKASQSEPRYGGLYNHESGLCGKIEFTGQFEKIIPIFGHDDTGSTADRRSYALFSGFQICGEISLQNRSFLQVSDRLCRRATTIVVILQPFVTVSEYCAPLLFQIMQRAVIESVSLRFWFESVEVSFGFGWKCQTRPDSAYQRVQKKFR